MLPKDHSRYPILFAGFLYLVNLELGNSPIIASILSFINSIVSEKKGNYVGKGMGFASQLFRIETALPPEDV
jgi:hypothetical protein